MPAQPPEEAGCLPPADRAAVPPARAAREPDHIRSGYRLQCRHAHIWTAFEFYFIIPEPLPKVNLDTKCLPLSFLSRLRRPLYRLNGILMPYFWRKYSII